MFVRPIPPRAATAVAATVIAIAPLAAGCAAGRSPKPAHPPETTAQGRPAARPLQTIDCQTARCVALTFDDGPTRYTAALLGILEQEHVPATFFVIGPHALRDPEDVLRAYRDGDAIGDHTVHHPNLNKLTPSEVDAEIDTAARQIASVPGHRPAMFRPPFGAENAKVRDAARRAGLPIVEWNVDPQDWKNHNAPLIASRVLEHVRPGAIVDMHDTHVSTLRAVPPIVEALKARGYTLVTLPQLFAETGRMAPGSVCFNGP